MLLEFVSGKYRITATLAGHYSVTIDQISGNSNYHLDLTSNPTGFTQDWDILKRKYSTMEHNHFTYNGAS